MPGDDMKSSIYKLYENSLQNILIGQSLVHRTPQLNPLKQIPSRLSRLHSMQYINI
jgi:hypothetical protein